jgi:uncharacterized protein (DUF433 family)
VDNINNERCEGSVVVGGTELLLGKGIYSVGEAARLSRVSAGRIRRWLRGYRFATRTGVGASLPVWAPEFPPIDGFLSLGFRDLLEVRFVDAFLCEGVSWPTIRKAAQRAREMFGDTHPLSTQKFKTDGRDIFAELRTRTTEPVVVELVRRQQYFNQVISPYLRGVEFSGDSPVRWWPMGLHKGVVIDPARAFGQPIVNDRGVPTAVLAEAVRVVGSVDDVAHWYEVSERSVSQAVEYEKHLAA